MRIQRLLFIKYSLACLLMILASYSLSGQTNKAIIVKNSATMSIFTDIGVQKDEILVSTFYDTNRIFSIHFVNPAVIFNSSSRSNHEIELSDLAFTKNEATLTVYPDSLVETGRIQHYDEKIFQLGIAYFYNFRCSKAQSPFEFYLGTGVSYSTSLSMKTPVSDHIYPWFTRKNNKQQFDIFFRPKIMYHLSNKFVADINLGISVYEYYSHSNTSEGSIFTTQPEQVKITKDDWFAQMFRMSIGVGYRL